MPELYHHGTSVCAVKVRLALGPCLFRLERLAMEHMRENGRYPYLERW